MKTEDQKEETKIDKIEEPMKIQFIPIIGQIINIPITGNITFIDPSMIPAGMSGQLLPTTSQVTDGPLKSGTITMSNENQKSADIKMETDEGEVVTLEEK